jgi:hypothetical protein
MIERSQNKKQKKDAAGKMNNSPSDKIRELAEELEAIFHPNEEHE